MSIEKITEEMVSELGEKNGYFRVNLPSTFKTYQTGNGEGIWAVALTKELTDKIEKAEIKQFYAYAANDSIYYPELVCGSRILAETRGDNRAVAVWENLTNSNEAEKNKRSLISGG